MSLTQNQTFNEYMKEYKEDFLYTDFGGDSEALGKIKCKHDYQPLGTMNLADWVKCTICGYIKKKGGKHANTNS